MTLWDQPVKSEEARAGNSRSNYTVLRLIAYCINCNFLSSVVFSWKWNEKWKVQWFKVRSKTDLEPAYSLTHHANKSSRITGDSLYHTAYLSSSNFFIDFMSYSYNTCLKVSDSLCVSSQPRMVALRYLTGTLLAVRSLIGLIRQRWRLRRSHQKSRTLRHKSKQDAIVGVAAR